MQRIQRFGMALGLVAAALLVFVGCAKKSPLEQMIENRARYTAEINGFFIQETPVVAEVDAEVEVEPGDGGEPADVEGTEVDEAPSMEVVQNAHLDILVKHDAFEKLPGITLDIIHADANENVKGEWKLWVDTSNVPRANPTVYGHVIENVDYVEGDGFAVEVRHPIPEAERGDYREFDGLGG